MPTQKGCSTICRINARLASFEDTCYSAFRSDRFYGKTFAYGMSFMYLFALVLPLMMTRKWAFGEAGDICWERTLEMNSKRSDVDWDANLEDGRSVEDYIGGWENNFHLLPVHIFNFISLAVSLTCFLVWLFLSPHNSELGRELDKKLFSFFAVQLTANYIVTVSSLGVNCTSSTSVFYVCVILSNFMSFGVSIIGTNLLCHRYLLEKAHTMTKIMDDATESTVWWLKQLDGSLKWEGRSLVIVVVGISVYFINEYVGRSILGLGFFGTLIMDTFFSVGLTVLFLGPIRKVLREGDNVANQSAGYKGLLATKWLTLSGSTLAVLSSSGLYIMIALWAIYGAGGEPFWVNPYLHPTVFAINADSVLNNVGMTLACGVFKPAVTEVLSEGLSKTALSFVRSSFKRGTKMLSAKKKTTSNAVQPEPAQFMFNSRAYENA